MSENTNGGLKRTPMYEIHKEAGARLVDYAGWEMPVWYQGAVEEHKAVRSTAGLFDLSHMAELFVEGPEAGAALDYAVLTQASKMPVGRARYTMICFPDGGILDDLIIYRLGDERFMVVANASNGPAVSAALAERLDGFDAVLNDKTDDYALLAVQGDNSDDICLPIFGESLAKLKYFRIFLHDVAEGEMEGVEPHTVLVARTGYTGELGYEVFVPSETGAAWWNRLSAQAEGFDMVPVGLAARDTLRLEAGMPLYGNELGKDVTPYDVDSGRLIKLDKPGGFVGQEALAKASQEPHRCLIGLEVSGRRPARGGYDLHASQDLEQGAIGVLTSGSPSPTLGKNIAVASINPGVEVPEVGSTVFIDIRGKATEATVVKMPFYSRTRS